MFIKQNINIQFTCCVSRTFKLPRYTDVVNYTFIYYSGGIYVYYQKCNAEYIAGAGPEHTDRDYHHNNRVLSLYRAQHPPVVRDGERNRAFEAQHHGADLAGQGENNGVGEKQFRHEPTGNLDGETQQAIMEIFRSLAEQGKCVIIVTHSPYVAERADEIVDLKSVNQIETA